MSILPISVSIDTIFVFMDRISVFIDGFCDEEAACENRPLILGLLIRRLSLYKAQGSRIDYLFFKDPPAGAES